MFDHDYVVIGSGFGGSVSALRLAEKGYEVAVLEMGKRYRQTDFAKTNWNVWKYLWLPRLGFHGIQQITLLNDVLVFHGAGVGGGSLVYANTLLTPPDEAFRDPRWPTDEDWRQKLAPHYATARFMLGVTEARKVFPADELLRDVVQEETGRGHTFTKHTVGVYFGEPDVTVPDPFFGGEGPERTGCTHCGECMVGCKRGAKNTLDKNYLWLAEKRGVVVHAETRVTDLRPLPGGGYAVHTERSTSRTDKQPRVITAGGVVVSASALGTVRLLLECKERGSLPALSDQVGGYVRTNSEVLLAATANRDDVDYGLGLVITSGVFPEEHTHVEVVRYGKGQDFMALMLTYLTGGGAPWPRWLRWVGNMVRHPVGFVRAHWPFGWAKKTAILLVMQPLSNFMRLRLGRRPWGRGLSLPHMPRLPASGMSVVSSRMSGDLPPSSRVTLARCFAAAAITTLPILGLPVKNTWSKGRSSKAVATAVPGSMRQATSRSSNDSRTMVATTSADAGTFSDGRAMTQLPAPTAAMMGTSMRLVG